MNKSRFLLQALLIFLFLSSCESKEKKANRLRLEGLERAAEEKELREKERERQVYERFINNSLNNGETPYENCFGRNSSCGNWGCSEIKVRTPNDSDVLVTLKTENKVFRHAFIKAGNSYTFEVPNGKYQAFFYYGRGWNPDKKMESQSCENLIGGFIANEVFGKDNPQVLDNDILSYELILQKNGNFSTRPSNELEAF